MHQVLLTQFPPTWDPSPVQRLLSQHDCDVALHGDERAATESELIELLEGINGVLTGSHPYTRRVLEASPSLKVIAHTGVGYDNIDLAAATELGIVVAVSRGASAASVADFVIGLLLAVVRRLAAYDRDMHEGRWTRSHTQDVSEDKTFGIFGLGAIGREVAKRARGFGMTILACAPRHDEDYARENDISYVSFEELLERSDFISISAPLTPETRGIFDEGAFRRMKPNAVIINTARGAIIDEPSLVKALESGWIRGAGLDVFDPEPLADRPLSKLDSVVITPHAAGWTFEAWDRLVLAAAENVIEVLEGRRPHGLVNEDCVPRR